MAKSAWKFMYITKSDLFLYMKKINNKIQLIENNINSRKKTINKWNCNQIFNINQGKYDVSLTSSIYNIPYKLGAFAKTRKPFFFRSKKKR